MPCNCFGKKKDPKSLPSDVPYSKVYTKPADEGDFVCSKKKKPLLDPEDYQARHESYHNDSSVSKSNTPSTAPAVASTPNSSLSASPSASPTSYRGALRRSELVEKRREFFRDYFVVDESKCAGGSSSTLPAGRSKNYDEMCQLRHVSQPSSLVSSPLQPPPPGPHLLRPVSPQMKMRSETFASPVFLSELRTASDEISRRWQMSDEERNNTPCSLKGKVKVFPVTYVDRTYSTEGGFDFDLPEVNSNINEFPTLNFNEEFPDINHSTEQQVILLSTQSSDAIVRVESPDIEFNTRPTLLTADTQYPGINVNPEFREIIFTEDRSLPKCKSISSSDEKISSVGSRSSSDVALNFPAVGGHRTPSPTIDATPRIAEPGNTRIVEQQGDDVPSSEINAPSDHAVADLSVDLRSNIPPQQELGSASDKSDKAGEEVRGSFSSDEAADDIPQQAWQEDEIRPLLDDDETPLSINDTSPNLIDNN